MSQYISRREMLLQTAVVGAGVWSAVQGSATGAVRSANEKLNIAMVGCGGRGGDNLKGVSTENIVALCDVDQRQAAAAYKQFPQAKRFTDYRQMLDRAQREFDAVVVSTPDHMHAPISLAAMQLGKHVYCEKPLTWSIEEARLMARTASRQKVATQMGTQGMAGNGARAGIEVIQSGVLGTVTQLHVWTDRAAGWWPQGVDRPIDAPPVPPELDWDLWLGVAPKRAYHHDYVPFRWRGWQDFGTGAIGDMGIHNAAMPFVGLQLGAPKSAEIIETSGLVTETFPAWSKLRWNFRPAAVVVRSRCTGTTEGRNPRPNWSAVAKWRRTGRLSWETRPHSTPSNGPAAIGICCRRIRFASSSFPILPYLELPGKITTRNGSRHVRAALPRIAGSMVLPRP